MYACQSRFEIIKSLIQLNGVNINESHMCGMCALESDIILYIHALGIAHYTATLQGCGV